MIQKSISNFLLNIKEKKPLVHTITNYVTANDCANIILAIGGSPVMADDAEEVEDMVSLASSLVINIGTLNSRTVESMILAGKKANSLNIPVILDPVGISATRFRTSTTKKLLNEIDFSVICGNVSEIKSLGGNPTKTRGVDSVDEDLEDISFIKNLALKYDTVIAMTGKKDIVTDGFRTCLINNGVEMLSRVTGTGCMTTCLVGAFCGTDDDYYLASIAGVVSMGLAGEYAYEALENKLSLGSFRVSLIDSISSLKYSDIFKNSNLLEI